MSDNIKFILCNDANEVVSELCESRCSKYQDNLKTWMKGSDFIFDSVQLVYYKCHKLSFKRGCSYIDSPDWIKNKKATINPKNGDDKCFQYAATVELNSEEIELYPERVSNIKLFINKYNWEGYSSKIDWKKIESNNPTIGLNIAYIKEVLPDYISKQLDP